MKILEKINPDVNAITPYEPGRPIEEVAREMGLDPDDITKLASNECAIGTSPRALEALKAATVEAFRYPDGGAYHLRSKLAARYGVAMSQIIVGNGSNEILEFVGHCFLSRETSCVFSAHAFIVYKLVTQLFGAHQLEIPMTPDLVHDVEAMLAAVRDDTTVVFLCNPNNPTGTMADNDAIYRFMDRVPDHVLVVFDEAYAEIALAEMPNTRQYVHQKRNVLICRTFSKAYGLAGLRLGYGIGPEPLVSALQKARQPFNVNLLAQQAGIAALDDDEFVARSRDVYRQGKACFEAACRELNLPFIPTTANFMLIKVGAGNDVAQALQQRGMIVRPMAGYGLPEYIRPNFGTPDENERFVRMLKEVVCRSGE